MMGRYNDRPSIAEDVVGLHVVVLGILCYGTEVTISLKVNQSLEIPDTRGCKFQILDIFNPTVRHSEEVSSVQLSDL